MFCAPFFIFFALVAKSSVNLMGLMVAPIESLFPGHFELAACGGFPTSENAERLEHFGVTIIIALTTRS